MRTDCERRMNETEEKKRKNETTGTFAIVEKMTDTLRKRNTIRIGA